MNNALLMRGVSLCTGIGGLDLSCEATGLVEIVGQVEIDEYCNRVLAHHWPRVKRLRDIREVKGNEFGAIELVVAGFPCQPTSTAGKRRGTADDRWLWPEVIRVIRSCQPAWCLLENVTGLISLGLDTVLDDLAGAGYEAWPLVFPAAAVGAPHLRERVFIVAHANSDGREQQAWSVGEVGRWAGDSGAATVGDATARWLRRGQTPGSGGLAAQPGQALADGCGRQAEPRLGGDLDGLPSRLDGHLWSRGWPALRGEAQHAWEPPRTVAGRQANRASRLKALGNAVVPQQVYPVVEAIAETWLRECQGQDHVDDERAG